MFNQDLAGTFESFTIQHLIAVLIVFTAVGLVIGFRDKLKEKKYYNFFRYAFVIITIGQEVSLSFFRISMGEWMLSTSLPLHLCGLAMIFTSIILITENKKVFTSTFFIMMIGATLAILTPAVEDGYGFPHYRFIQFFLGHGMILVNFSFALFVMDYYKEIRYKHLLHNLFTVLVVATFDLIVNVLTGGNYLYLMAKPGPNTAFDLFGDHPWYLINIFLFGIPVFFHIFYLPFLIRNLINNKKQLRTS